MRTIANSGSARPACRDREAGPAVAGRPRARSRLEVARRFAPQEHDHRRAPPRPPAPWRFRAREPDAGPRETEHLAAPSSRSIALSGQAPAGSHDALGKGGNRTAARRRELSSDRPGAETRCAPSANRIVITATFVGRARRRRWPPTEGEETSCSEGPRAADGCRANENLVLAVERDGERVMVALSTVIVSFSAGHVSRRTPRAPRPRRSPRARTEACCGKRFHT